MLLNVILILIRLYLLPSRLCLKVDFLYIFYSYMQIPLGVLLHNENNLDEMGKILAHYMKLVPTVVAEGHLQLANGSVIDFDDTRFHSILIGGDQLTVA